MSFSGRKSQKSCRETGVDLFFLFGDYSPCHYAVPEICTASIKLFCLTEAKSGICDEKSRTRPQKAGRMVTLQLLQDFTSDDNETNQTKSDSSYLKKNIDALETAILCVLWHKILQRFHSTSKSLQRADMTLGSCAALYNGIESFCQHLRDEFDTTEKDGLKLKPVYRKPMCLKTNETEKRRRLLIMKERTLDALELWKMLVNPFLLELTFQSSIP